MLLKNVTLLEYYCYKMKQETKHLASHFCCLSGIMFLRNLKYLCILQSANYYFVLCSPFQKNLQLCVQLFHNFIIKLWKWHVYICMTIWAYFLSDTLNCQVLWGKDKYFLTISYEKLENKVSCTCTHQ